MGQRLTQRERLDRGEALTREKISADIQREQLRVEAKRIEKEGLIGQTAGGAAGRAALMQARLGKVQVGMSMFSLIKPVIFIGFALLIILGPGLAAVLAIAESLNIWMWIIGIVLALMILRQRR